MPKEDDEQKRRELAEFRFGVIAPLVCGTYARTEKEIIRRGILSKAHTTPDGQSWKVDARTLRRWVAQHKRHGLAGLYDKRRKTLGVFTAIDEKILESAKALRKEIDSRSIKDILHHLSVVDGIDVSKISKTTLNLHLNRLGAKKEKAYSEQGAFQRWAKEHINELWQSDCSDGIWLPDPTGLKREKQTSLITFIDDASRFCTHGEFYWNEQLPSLFDCFKKALIKHAKVKKLYTDNGSIYRSKSWKSACAELSIEHRFAEKQKPSGKGKVERHFLSIQRGFYKEAQHSGLKTLTELNEFFWAWLDERYHKEEHGSLLGLTPLERWQKEEETIKRISPEKVQEALKLRANRKVDFKTALINLNGRRYQASKALGGEQIEVRWEFDRLNEVEVWQRGKLIEKANMFVPSADIDYSKRPVLDMKPKPGIVLEGAKNYRKALVGRHQFARDEPLEVNSYRSELLTESEFRSLLEKNLARELIVSETKECAEFFSIRSPFSFYFIEEILSRFIAEKGRGLHIKSYLRRIEETQRKMR